MDQSQAAAIRARHAVPGSYAIHGHAIVSADDFIAGRDGLTPPELRNEADWRRFQAALDRAAVTVLGRLGHEANPNVARRRRLVMTSRVSALLKEDGCWFWNPEHVTLGEALDEVAPGGGMIAVPGGQAVFDFFLAVGYDAFELARAEGVTIGGGTRLFSGLGPDRSAEKHLQAAGLVAGRIEVLDAAANVTLRVWRPAGQPTRRAGE